MQRCLNSDTVYSVMCIGSTGDPTKKPPHSDMWKEAELGTSLYEEAELGEHYFE
jgi:hypothetical protein